jgi:hypothetical protein
MAIIKIVPMPGIPGPTGASAYQIAVTNGFVGTEQEWLDSLGNQNLDGIVTQTWGYPTESSKAIRPELAGESIALKSSESAAIRWHVRENSPSIVLSPLLPTAAVVTPVGNGDYYVDFTINTQDYAPTTSQHYYEVIAPESTDYEGSFLPVSSNTTSLRLLYEADPGVFDSTGAEIVQPSVYSQFEVNEDGAYIKIANWTDGPGGYSQSWQFTKDGEIHFPYGPSNNRTGSGDVLRFAQSVDQAIISGPSTTSASPTAQRLVIAGADGYIDTSGEGGDIYLWAGVGGDANGSGGDIKVDGGNGQGTGGGGTVKVRGGYTPDGTGGFVEITAGGSNTGTGGRIDIIGGYSNTVGEGGNILLQTSEDGTITLSGDGGEFLNDATVPGNQIATLSDIPGGLNTIEDPILKDRISFTDNSDTERMYLEYSGTGATRIVSGDDLSIRSQNGDIILYPGNDNSWGGDGGTGKAYVHWGNDSTNAAPENEIATVGYVATAKSIYSRINVSSAEPMVGTETEIGALLYSTVEGNATFVIPANASATIPIGSEIKFATDSVSQWLIERQDEGAMTLAADGGNGYTGINDTYPYIIPANSTGTLLKVDTDAWILSGMRLTD